MTQALATFVGYVGSIKDVNLLLDACIQGSLPLLPRRLQSDEQAMLIRSGSIFIYDESVSNIKRWTDGRPWSPRRSQGDFYIYREIEKKGRGRAIKEGGLVRKMISYVRDGISYGLVSYFTDDDVHRGVLTSPTTYTQAESPSLQEQICFEPHNLQDTWEEFPLTMSFPSAYGWETPWLDRDVNVEFDQGSHFGIKEELDAVYSLVDSVDVSRGFGLELSHTTLN